MNRPKLTVKEFEVSPEYFELNAAAKAAVESMSPATSALFGVLHLRIQDAVLIFRRYEVLRSASLAQNEPFQDVSSSTSLWIAMSRMTASWEMIQAYVESTEEPVPQPFESLYLTLCDYHKYFQFHDDL